MESKLVLHTKTRHINVYAHPENVTHLTKEKMGTLNLQGGTAAYTKQFVDEHNQDESAHPYIQESISTLEGTVTEHIEDTSNPHSVTKEQVGLGNVDNTADLDKPISTATQAALDGKQATISDLETIRSGAAAGATALQPEDAAETYATKEEIAEQYTESNLVPKVPVTFEKAQVSDFYTVVGSPTITDGVASGFINNSYLISSSNLSKPLETECYARITVGKSTGNYNVFLGFTGGDYPVRYSPSYKFSFYKKNAGGWSEGVTQYAVGNLVDIRYIYKDGYLRLYTKLASADLWTQEMQLSVSSNPIYGVFYFGRNVAVNTQYIAGAIDLNHTYIKANGKYFVPPLSSTIISVPSMVGATSSAAGASGLVPAPAAGDEAKFLRGDGTWVGSTSSAAWGAISGTLSDQTDLQNALNAKQATISDLATIRSGASAGATAVQPAALQTAINSVKRNIGEIVPSMIPLTDAGLHLLDGAVISGSGSYSAFVTYISGLVSNYPGLFETEANWQSAVSTYGVCGKFVYDSVNNTVRLPKITGIVEGTTDLTALGDLVEAGLPNITGTFSAVRRGGANNPSPTGAFTQTTWNARNGSGGGDDYGGTFTLNASRSNSIYGNSNTVQPQTIKVHYYIVIANSTKTEIEVDIDEIATDLNGKADVDLTNCTKPHIVETYSNGTSWYRIYSDGWCEQGGRVQTPNHQYGQTTVDLLKTMANKNYSITLGGCNPPINGNYCFSVGGAVEPTYFVIFDERTTGSNHTNDCYWVVKGYMA